MNTFFGFRWGKTITIIVADLILLYLYAYYRPICGYDPKLGLGSCPSSSEQSVIMAISIVITAYLVITIVYSLSRKGK